jgi:hypothetical protein
MIICMLIFQDSDGVGIHFVRFLIPSSLIEICSMFQIQSEYCVHRMFNRIPFDQFDFDSIESVDALNFEFSMCLCFRLLTK